MPVRIAFLVSLLVCALAARAADPLARALPCGKEGVAGGLGAGSDLTRHVVDLNRFPDAICNDGTPAIFYYAPATRAEDRNRWLIFLQGGGTCFDGQSCAQRWCSVDTNYGMDKMSTSLSKPAIRGGGFLTPDAQNRFGTWNRVLIYYCSSDAWSGTATRTLQASDGKTTREYAIHFRGTRIIDAVLDTLRNASPSRRMRAARHDTSVAAAEASAWPDLDTAEAVVFAGSSAGGAGVRANLDRVGTKLRATNPTLDFRGVIDAIYGTLGEHLDFSKTTYCAKDPARGCRYETFTRAAQTQIEDGLYGARRDDSCVAWHAANAPGTEWRCSDGEHVNLHHLSTPFFLHHDLQDTNIGGDWVAAGFGTPADYGRTVENELRNLPVPEEPRGGTPGLFVPQCTHHESFSNTEPVFRVRLAGVSYHDAVWNWWSGAQPQQLIRPFTGTPGAAPECP